jgi:hypothetical protein
MALRRCVSVSLSCSSYVRIQTAGQRHAIALFRTFATQAAPVLSGVAKAKLEKEKRLKKKKSKLVLFKVRWNLKFALPVRFTSGTPFLNYTRRFDMGLHFTSTRLYALYELLPARHLMRPLKCRLVTALRMDWAQWDTTHHCETVQVHLGVDPRKPNQNIRGLAQLPYGTGKAVSIAVFARGEKAEEARAAGATFVGAEDLVERISAGELGLSKVIATPDTMQIVGKVTRVRWLQSSAL